MSDIREMRIFSAEQIVVPNDLPTILKDFSKAVIKNGNTNQEEIVNFCAEYFEAKAAEYAKNNKKQSSRGGPDIEELGKQIAA